MRFFTSLFLTLIATVSLSAQPYSSDKLRQKCLVLRRFLELNHYQPLVWNDASSHRLFDKWMDELDKDKRYFTTADINQLSSFRDKLDDEMQGKQWGFFDRSIELYHLRLRQSDSIAKVALSKPMDFSKPDNIRWPFANYAASQQEFAQRWQQLIKWKILYRVLDEEEDSLHPFTAAIPANFSALETKAIEAVSKQQSARMEDDQVSSPDFEKSMEEDYLNAICWCYDPHTEYMNIAAEKQFETELSRFEYSAGIGIEKNDKGEWSISKLVPGGTAWRTGELHQGDILLKIKSGNNKEEELEDMTEQEVLALLQGSSDDKLIITTKTTAGNQKTIPLTKEKVEDDENIVKSFELANSKKIGYIRLPGFYSETDEEKENNNEGCANDVAKEVVKLKEDSIQGLILDLRYNGGGSMWEALQLAGIFIDIGPLSTTKDKTGKVHFLKDPNRGTIYDGPMLVMVNAQSASASELVSAVLQDYHRAVIVGGTTYGKGTAQDILPLDTTGKITDKDKPDEFVKVTMAKFYRVDGSTTQWKGVIPDINLPDFYIPQEYLEKGQASALLPDNSKVAMYEALPPIPITQLKQLSEARVKADSSFSEVRQFSDWIQQYTAGITIPLQWASFFNYSKKVDEAYAVWEKKEDNKPMLIKTINNRFDTERIKSQSQSNNETNEAYLGNIEKDEYIRECYNIMLDWINLKK